MFKKGTSFSTEPIFKNTSFTVPLNPSSAHHKSVHRWPLQMIGMLRSLSSEQEYFEKARTELLRRFRIAGTSSRLLQMLASAPALGRPRRSHHQTEVGDTRWIPLRFHPVWSRLAKTVRDFNLDEGMQGLYRLSGMGQNPRLRLCWKNGIPNASVRIERSG